jgi:hypothetical protein
MLDSYPSHLSIRSLRDEGQSKFKISVAKSIKCYDETGSHEDCHRKGRPRVTSAADDRFFRVTCLRICSQK